MRRSLLCCKFNQIAAEFAIFGQKRYPMDLISRLYIVPAVLLALLLPAGSAHAQKALAGAWSGTLSDGGMSLTVVFNFSPDDSGALTCTMDSPDQGARGIVAEVRSATDYSVEVAMPSLGVLFKGVLFRDSLTGTFSQFGRDFPLALSRGVKEPARPQTPQPPFPYSSEDVVFTNAGAGATLAGTLVLPDGAGHDVPVVLMVTGSGLENRDEEVFGHRPFLVIADRLARRGIATLRYDDRSFGASEGGDVAGATTLDFRDDAMAGLEFLRSRGFGSVGILGHSEGGSIAFMLGASGDADFVVSLAGIGVKGDEALTAQANRVMELRGMERRYSVGEYRSEVMLGGNAWLRWFVNYDPVPDIKACSCPVFAVNGERDCQVVHPLNLESIRANLPEGGANLVRSYPALNHLFQHCRTGDTGEYRSIEETFSDEVIEDMASWILDVVKKK